MTLSASGISICPKEGDFIFGTTNNCHEFCAESPRPSVEVSSDVRIRILPRLQVLVAELKMGPTNLQGLMKRLPPFLEHKLEQQHELFKAILLQLQREVRSQQSGQSVIVESLLRVLLTQVLRQHEGLRNTEDGQLFEFSVEIANSLQLMQDNLESAWTVDGLADAVGLSRAQFAMQFAKALGKSPMRYLYECRMVRAQELLQHNHYALKEIAPMVGYKSTSAFSTAFKRWSGHSPLEERLALSSNVGSSRNRDS
ncbi:MAG: AraC family transcriptional regulator [Planctomycetaceae bacterium]|nr:AraC family transcriptional regulator [Planctomycetaceae bacterium]